MGQGEGMYLFSILEQTIQDTSPARPDISAILFSILLAGGPQAGQQLHIAALHKADCNFLLAAGRAELGAILVQTVQDPSLSCIIPGHSNECIMRNFSLRALLLRCQHNSMPNSGKRGHTLTHCDRGNCAN